MNRHALKVLFLPLAACSEAGVEPEAAFLSGSWEFTQVVTIPDIPVMCSRGGTVVITQHGESFLGVNRPSFGTCSLGDTTAVGPGDLVKLWGPDIESGQLSGNRVVFVMGACSYTGEVTQVPSDRIVATTLCDIGLTGGSYHMNGEWEAIRED